jgi:hypothetical protein
MPILLFRTKMGLYYYVYSEMVNDNPYHNDGELYILENMMGGFESNFEQNG